MLTRRNFLKGLVSGVVGVGLLPYLPTEITPAKSVTLNPASIKQSDIIYGIAGEGIRAGQAVYVGTDGLMYLATNKQITGIYLGGGAVATRGVITINASALPDSPYYLKAGE